MGLSIFVARKRIPDQAISSDVEETEDTDSSIDEDEEDEDEEDDRDKGYERVKGAPEYRLAYTMFQFFRETLAISMLPTDDAIFYLLTSYKRWMRSVAGVHLQETDLLELIDEKRPEIELEVKSSPTRLLLTEDEQDDLWELLVHSDWEGTFNHDLCVKLDAIFQKYKADLLPVFQARSISYKNEQVTTDFIRITEIFNFAAKDLIACVLLG